MWNSYKATAMTHFSFRNPMGGEQAQAMLPLAGNNAANSTTLLHQI